MKMVIAHIRPEALPDVKDALIKAGFPQMTASTCRGTAPSAERQMFRGVERKVTLLSRVRIELGVRESDVEKATSAICEGAKPTGAHGKIFVVDLHEAITIWNGDRGESSL